MAQPVRPFCSASRSYTTTRFPFYGYLYWECVLNFGNDFFLCGFFSSCFGASADFPMTILLRYLLLPGSFPPVLSPERHVFIHFFCIRPPASSWYVNLFASSGFHDARLLLPQLPYCIFCQFVLCWLFACNWLVNGHISFGVD